MTSDPFCDLAEKLTRKKIKDNRRFEVRLFIFGLWILEQY
jgi:hypothetical protein